MMPDLHRLPGRIGGIAVALALGAGSAWAGAAVQGVRIGQHEDFTRFVIDLSAETGYRAFTLPDPYRVVIDLPEADWRLAAPPALPEGGLIRAFRYGQFTPGSMRVVLDVSAPALVDKVFLLEPSGGAGHRLVLDLRRVSAAAYRASAGGFHEHAWSRSAGAAGAARARVPEKPVARRDARRVVVVDAGHGGVDPGTIGVRGTQEKEITLAFAKELQRRLQRTGRYSVVLTRAGDVVLPLRERIALARRAGGELFISLHADSIANAQIRGASVYTLSETASDREAAALAAKENKADIIAGVDLGGQDQEVANILIDLAQRETMNLSARFAAMLIEELGEETRLLRRTHRFAGFAVLKAPDIPSVLVELGYLSNRDDERLLRQAEHRAKVAAAVQRAIDEYFARTDRLSRT